MGHHDFSGLLLSLALGLGLGLGARHALEPDHLAAMGALTARSGGMRRAAWSGMLWGLGHTLALLGAGLTLATLSTGMPAALSDALELVVAVMLVALGCQTVLGANRDPVSRSGHVHAGQSQRRAVPARRVGHRASARPLLVGMVHGLAGSGALTALAMAQLPTTLGRCAFIALFGLGSLLGMAASAGLWGWPLARLLRRPVTARWVVAAAGVCSSAIGVFWGISAVGRMLA